MCYIIWIRNISRTRSDAKRRHCVTAMLFLCPTMRLFAYLTDFKFICLYFIGYYLK